MKTLLIIGAAGYLGSHLVRYAAERTNYTVLASDLDKSRIPAGANVTPLSNEELFQHPLLCDLAVNCAFSRGNDVAGLVSALRFNERLVLKMKEGRYPVVNISSQGLYKPLEAGNFADEDGEIRPVDMYALGKFAQERLFTSNLGDRVTNIRMASLAANARFLVFFVDSVMQGRAITVTAPNQYASLLDVEDAVTGIFGICALSENERKSIYNLGTGKQYSILRLAELVNETGTERGYPPVEIRVEDKGNTAAAGMDPARLMQDTGWRPEIEMKETIRRMFENREEMNHD
ncbi:MAG: NAD(P)-dependent oxidoreductase [Clostridia bacterium]|nr:NAD(P)-dependent oxidoreductase [Clostridia bacterium]